jgi:release factor glutamine methyltransferase
MSLLLDEVARATTRLAHAGVAAARHDAEELAAWVHGVRRGELHTVADRDFDTSYWAAIGRRENREPLQHITGRAYFRYLELQVGPGVFIPRPETESVAGWAIDRLRAMDVAEPLVVDLGTGCAAIALAIAHEVPRSRVHAVEVDEHALNWARKNVAAHPAGPRVTLHRTDIDGCLGELDGTVDLVVSNPPYIPLGAVVRDPEVAAYDPPLALWGGADGTDVVRVVERVAARLLRPGAPVVVEHADEQGAVAPLWFPETRGWDEVRAHRDLAGRPRFVTARRRRHPQRQAATV